MIILWFSMIILYETVLVIFIEPKVVQEVVKISFKRLVGCHSGKMEDSNQISVCCWKMQEDFVI